MGSEQKIRRALPSPEEIARLPKNGGSEFNRLIFSASPYLLQHARNPVDWHPWGEEVFALAKKLDKPVFLSVGYATCHWCHVMEHESFEDEAVATLMNEAFVCVKVDREERPDIDHIYMAVTQMLTGSGGWPMTVVMTPEREPFFAGTYFPKESRYGRPGLRELVPTLSKAWRERRGEVVVTASQVVKALKRHRPKADDVRTLPTVRALEQAYEQLAANYDAQHGGFGRAPKFPTPHNLSFLLRQELRRADGRALEMVENTLQAMRRGGIFDHIGYGYHRYSTDAEWLVPHFEKMLYDQALIAIAALECYQLTADRQYGCQAQEIFDYVARDMTDRQGGFFSAEDADSEGEEGRFYVWTTKELREVLSNEDAELFMGVYNCIDAGNYIDGVGRKRTGANIPHLRASFAAIAEAQQVPVTALHEKLRAIRLRLLEARSKRSRPLLDDKILADWNGLMIAAFAIGGRVLSDIELTQRAARAATFVWDNMRDSRGRLLKRWRRGQAGLTGLLDDYAFMTWGILELYQTTGEPVWLERAVELHKQMRQHFCDDGHGGFFQTPDDGEKLLVRTRDIYDGALPSGNAVVARNSLRLARLTGDESFAYDAEGILRSAAANINHSESNHCMSMQALDLMLEPMKEVVIAAPNADAAKAIVSAMTTPFLPRMVWHLWTPQTAMALAELAPYTKGQEHDGEKTLIYVCENFTCNLPTSDVTKALRLLGIPRT